MASTHLQAYIVKAFYSRWFYAAVLQVFVMHIYITNGIGSNLTALYCKGQNIWRVYCLVFICQCEAIIQTICNELIQINLRIQYFFYNVHSASCLMFNTSLQMRGRTVLYSNDHDMKQIMIYSSSRTLPNSYELRELSFPPYCTTPWGRSTIQEFQLYTGQLSQPLISFTAKKKNIHWEGIHSHITQKYFNHSLDFFVFLKRKVQTDKVKMMIINVTVKCID